MLGFGKKELWLGNSMEHCTRIRRILDEAGISYTYRVSDRQGQLLLPASGTLRARTGSPGIRPGTEKEYRIFVKKADFDKAAYLIR